MVVYFILHVYTYSIVRTLKTMSATSYSELYIRIIKITNWEFMKITCIHIFEGLT